MTASRIMVIRHGEKPRLDGAVLGVNESGAADANELSVRGWQRAGALVRFFAPVGTTTPPQGIGRPDVLFAQGLGQQVTSVRAQHTLTPLAQLLGLPISTQFRKGEERALAAAATSSSGTVLIAWEHKAICELANILMGNVQSTPQTWPDERFDIVWVFNADGAGWQFHQVPELVLPGDAVTPIA